MDLLWRYANVCVQGVWNDVVDVCHSKHFMITDVSATGQKSLWQIALEFLGTGMMVVSLKRGDYRLGEGEVENVSEDAC